MDETIKQLELYIQSLGFKKSRVYVKDNMVIIEILKYNFAAFLEKADELVSGVKSLGYDRVLLDLEGYRTLKHEENSSI